MAHDPKTDGQTRTQQQETADRDVPRTPNERDTSADSQKDSQPADDAVGKAAQKDMESGRQDTDRGPVTDKVYNDKVREGSRD